MALLVVSEVFARWRVAGLELLLAVDNRFNVEWNEAQFATTSDSRASTRR